MSDQQKHTRPWAVEDNEKRYDICDPEHRYCVEKPRQLDRQWFEDIAQADARCAELNAAERVRDAAEVLLAACWAVIRSNALKAHPELEEMVGNAIAAAEE